MTGFHVFLTPLSCVFHGDLDGGITRFGQNGCCDPQAEGPMPCR
jgi:hypothetical protein